MLCVDRGMSISVDVDVSDLDINQCSAGGDTRWLKSQLNDTEAVDKLEGHQNKSSYVKETQIGFFLGTNKCHNSSMVRIF